MPNMRRGTIDDSEFDFGTSDFTLQVWTNFNAFGTSEQTLMEKFNGPDGNGWTLTQRSGPSLHFFVNGGVLLETGEGIAVANFTADAWHDIIVRRNANVFTLFFDGNAITTNSGLNPNINSDQPLRIGNRQGPQSFPMDGRIDEAAIWNRALSDAEVLTLFRGSVPEPNSQALSALGLAMFAAFSRAQRATTPCSD